jgi:hypothetical protein
LAKTGVTARVANTHIPSPPARTRRRHERIVDMDTLLLLLRSDRYTGATRVRSPEVDTPRYLKSHQQNMINVIFITKVAGKL